MVLFKERVLPRESLNSKDDTDAESECLVV